MFSSVKPFLIVLKCRLRGTRYAMRFLKLAPALVSATNRPGFAWSVEPQRPRPRFAISHSPDGEVQSAPRHARKDIPTDVARQCGLPSDWLNAHATTHLSPVIDDREAKLILHLDLVKGTSNQPKSRWSGGFAQPGLDSMSKVANRYPSCNISENSGLVKAEANYDKPMITRSVRYVGVA